MNLSRFFIHIRGMLSSFLSFENPNKTHTLKKKLSCHLSMHREKMRFGSKQMSKLLFFFKFHIDCHKICGTNVPKALVNIKAATKIPRAFVNQNHVSSKLCVFPTTDVPKAFIINMIRFLKVDACASFVHSKSLI